MPPSLNTTLILLQLTIMILAPVWILKIFHYFCHPINFLFPSQPSLIPTSHINHLVTSLQQYNFLKTSQNLILFAIFFTQHVLMATISFKSYMNSIWPNYYIFQRIIYNMTSSMLLIAVFQLQSTQHYALFELPKFICYPLAIIGVGFVVLADKQIGQSLLFPYKFKELFTSRQIPIQKPNYTSSEQLQSGIQIKGIYSLIRHPMQSGTLLVITFGNNLFTLDKMIYLLFFLGCIVVGVTMEEKRLLKRYKQYQSYMNVVKQRFLPKII